MSQPLRGDSPRRAAARRFGVALDAAITAAGMSVRGLAREAGISRASLSFYRSGDNLPSLETATRLSDVLGRPSLVALVAESRTGTCEMCGRTFTSAMSAGNRRYCTEDCRSVAAKKRVGIPTRERAISAERRAARYVSAIESYCRACEPEGVCRTADCPLRVASPLPIARRAVA